MYEKVPKRWGFFCSFYNKIYLKVNYEVIYTKSVFIIRKKLAAKYGSI